MTNRGGSVLSLTLSEKDTDHLSAKPWPLSCHRVCVSDDMVGRPIRMPKGLLLKISTEIL